MNTPSNEGGVGMLFGIAKTAWSDLTSQVEERYNKKKELIKEAQEKVEKMQKQGRTDHFAAGHQSTGTTPPEHFATLVDAALKLDTQRHAQGLERFKAADTASKPGKTIGFSAQGDVNISEVHPPQVKEPKAPKQEPVTAPAAKPKKPKIRPTRRGGTY